MLSSGVWDGTYCMVVGRRRHLGRTERRCYVLSPRDLEALGAEKVMRSEPDGVELDDARVCVA